MPFNPSTYSADKAAGRIKILVLNNKITVIKNIYSSETGELIGSEKILIDKTHTQDQKDACQAVIDELASVDADIEAAVAATPIVATPVIIP